MNKIKSLLRQEWRTIGSYLVIGSGLGFILTRHLSNLTGGVSSAEVSSASQAKSLHSILNNPVFGPYKLLQYLALHIHDHKVLALRLISVIFGICALWLFYRVIKAWYTPRIALLSTLLLACSSWFLHAARGATPIINFTAVIALLWCGLAFKAHKERPGVLVIITLITGWLLYVPGFIWFMAAGLIWQRKDFISAVKNASNAVGIGCIALFLIFLAPIGYAAFLHPGVLRVFAGLPELHSLTIGHIVSNIVSLPRQLLYHGPTDSSAWLKGTPLIDFFGVLIGALGAYSCYYHLGLDRTRSLIGLLLLSTVLVVLGGVDIVILLPLIYVFIASGIAFMLQQWFTIFPRNPIAKFVGPGLLTLAVLFSCFYQLNNYFVAWRHSPDTKAAFSRQL